jgi:hypothetical protein
VEYSACNSRRSVGKRIAQFRARSRASFFNPGTTPDSGLVSLVPFEFELFLKSMTDFFLKSITELLLAVFALSTSSFPYGFRDYPEAMLI